LRRLAIAAALLLPACATTSGAIKLSDNTYQIERQASSGFDSVTALQAQVVNDAKVYCADRGQVASVISATHNEGPFVLGKFPRATVRFNCEGPSPP
jgi:putative hemolysin